jgi:site-specific recombinase XerD
VLSIPRHPTRRVLLMATYAAGLRVSEVVRLQLTDFDRERLIIRAERGPIPRLFMLRRARQVSDRSVAEPQSWARGSSGCQG